jgi:transcriptional regulator with XRE-family HTH domain
VKASGAKDMEAAKAAAISFLRQRLSASGMSHTQLAKKAECERSHISEMLSGRVERFSLARINRVLAVFGASIRVSYRLVSDDRLSLTALDQPKVQNNGRRRSEPSGRRPSEAR